MRMTVIALVVALAGGAGTATSVFAGASGSAGSAPEGSSLKAWGADNTGQLGDGGAVKEHGSRTPVAVSGSTCAVATAVNDNDSFAVLRNGTIEGWGVDEGNKEGDLGDNGSNFPLSTKPIPIDEEGITTAVGITVDTADVYVLLANGTIVGWGDDRYGEFGNGSDPGGGSNTPVPIATSVTDAKALATSEHGSTLALLSNGEIDSWGEETDFPNEQDTLGREGSGATPGRVEIEKGKVLTGAEGVAEGANFSLALAGGEVKAWGNKQSPTNAALGAGSKAIPSEVPVTVGGETPLKGVNAIAAGANFGLALVNGEVKAWGDGQLGQLGNGTKSESDLPVAVAKLTDIVAIAATEDTALALDSHGRVWAWGNNTQGEVGTGSSEDTFDEPVEIASLGEGNVGLASGIDSEHEIALGPNSGSCEPSTKSNEEKTVEGNPITGTPTQTSTTPTTPTQTSTTETSPGPSTPPASAAAHLVLGCTGQKLSLTDVVEQNGHVLLDGAAVSSLAGHKVKILFDGTHQVATTTVAADGLFNASAPLPPPKLRGSNSSRYLAESGSLKSLDLKLTRRLILYPPKSAAGKVSLSGEVQPPLAKPPATVLVQQQLSCGAAKTVAYFKPSTSGHFTVSVPAPAGATAAIYRLSTRVRGNTTSAKLFPTDSLPEPVNISA
jgi:alpha-tubulin suppressor-like RCC1 family protein